MLLDRIIALRNDRTVYRDGGKCLKVFEKNVSKSKVFTEAFNQVQAQCAGVNVPSISQITQIDGKWSIIYDFVEGKSLSEKMSDNSDTVACLEKLVDMQSELHKPVKTNLPELKDRLKRDIVNAGLHGDLTDRVIEILESLPDGDGIFHGCFTPENIILGDDGKDYIIDWTHAAEGDICADAAATYLTFIADGKSEEATAYLKIFASRTKFDIKQVEKWFPVIAAAKLSYSNERESKLLTPWVEFG